ncbi:MAG: hypothetical protein QXW80_05830 [Candidatus Micrarchaeia archaeon]
MSIFKIISKYRKSYNNWFSVLLKMYRTRSKVKDRKNIEIKAILRNTKETVDAPYTVVYGYTMGRSTHNPRIHNLTIHKNLLGFSYDYCNFKYGLRNEETFLQSFFNEDYNFLKVGGKSD